jgi:hypothetical protein
MKLKKAWVAACIGLVCWAGFDISALAQVFSQNIVGYASLSMYPGNNFVANQFGNTNNTLNFVFQAPTPEGATFTKWDSASAQYLPLSTYHANSGWTINYDLTYGEGGLLHSPSLFTNTYAGDVWPGFNDSASFVPPLVSSNGVLLLSCYIPISPATFHDVVGREPRNGEAVTILNAMSQVSTTTTFANGFWNNGVPTLDIGQSAFYTLMPVPEPEVIGLFGVGAVLLAAGRRMRKR